MKVAITGGTGFLGSQVVKHLESKKGFEPIILTRRILDKNKIDFKTTDYSAESLKRVLRGFNAIVHLAAIRGTNGSIEDFQENEVLTERVLKACVDNSIKNVVLASSISIYSDKRRIPWTEEQLPSPKTLYGISKMSCEYIADLYHRRYGLNIKKLRIAQVLGEREKKGYMINTFIDKAYSKQTLNVVGKSIAKREFVYVKDVTTAIELSLKKEEFHGVFNIGSNKAYSNLEVAQTVNKVFNNENNYTYDEAVDEKIEPSLMSSQKAFKLLGYKAKYNLTLALKDIKKIKVIKDGFGNV